MSEPIAIEVENLSKSFGRGRKRVQALKDVSFRVEPGHVYGFLGPNGAGKTTTIRLMLDLIRPDAGRIRIYGKDVRREHGVLRRVGAIVEGASFYDFLSGRKNLEVIARTRSCYDPKRISELLEQVGLAERANHAVKGYSTGMKQRLGIAAALLNDPDLLLLDEPTNGFDPAGIQEMRLFIRSLADEQGKTVFLSSHILSEVEQICDRVIIIHKGRIIREGLVRELLVADFRVDLEAEPIERAERLLSGKWDVFRHGEWVSVNASRREIPDILNLLLARGISVYQVVSKRQSLEEYFLSVTQEAEDV